MCSSPNPSVTEPSGIGASIKEGRSLPVAADDLVAYACQAHPPTLLMTTAHLTGDWSLLRSEWRPNIMLGGTNGSYPDGVADEIRRVCSGRLRQLVETQALAPSRPDYDTLARIAGWFMGRNVDPYIRAYKNALLFEGEDPCRPKWSKANVAKDRPFHVVIIGAGLSGLLIGYRLKQAGVSFEIIEKNRDVGGVWEDNDYPGSRVDLNSFIYSYSFAQEIWGSYFAEQPELRDYIRNFAKKHGLNEYIRLGTEVISSRWDEGDRRWVVDLAGDAGSVDADVLICAVGQLSLPKMPSIPGQGDFEGAQFHSARWDHAVEIQGKRVGVVGNAASAMQFIPKLAQQAEKVTVFMRTPNWLIPQPLLHEKVGEAERWLMQNLPYYAGWYRAYELIPSLIGFPEVSIVDPDFPPTELATSAMNSAIRGMVLDYLERQIADRPDLRSAVVPDYPFSAKRMVADNGTWINTLKRDNVEVVQSSVRRIDPQSVETADGADHPLDILIYGTGFRANEFLMPMEFIGRNGISLHEKWSGEARAYLGMTVPDFPNLFLMYGPNTNLLVNLSSAIYFFEGQANYIVDAIHHMLCSGGNSIEVREEVFDSYNRRLDETSAMRTWQWSAVSTWYKGPSGRSAQNYPFSAEEFAQRMGAIDPTDFDVV